jgi:hypothetical protein
LVRVGSAEMIIGAATEWWTAEGDRYRQPAVVPRELARRWPVLAAWRWLLAIPTLEDQLAGSILRSDIGASREGPTDLAYRGILPRGLGQALTLAGRGDDGGIGDEGQQEEYALSRSIGQANREAACRRRAWGRYAGPISVTTALLLGLRKLRYEYARRADAWVNLREREVGLSEIQRRGSGAPGAQSVVGGPLAERVAMWAVSPSGRGVLAQMRWRIATREAIVERVRGEIGSSSRQAEGRQLSDLVDSLVVPRRLGEQISWGPRLISWEEAWRRWQRRCSCCDDRGMPGEWLCGYCGGARNPSILAVLGEGRGQCRWCSGQSPEVCPVCARGVHFAGSCRQWLHGADRRYALQPTEQWWMCPDCFALFVQGVSATRERGDVRGVGQELLQHVDGLIRSPRAGAGHAVAPMTGPRPSGGRARRFILGGLRGRRWVQAASLRQAYVRQCAQVSSLQAGRAFQAAVATLSQEEFVWRSDDGRAIRLRGEERQRPFRARIRGGRRRRRLESISQEGPPMHRSRTDANAEQHG